MSPIYVNGRFLSQDVTGVQRFAIEIIKSASKFIDFVILVPPNCKKKPPFSKVKQIGFNKGHLWEQVDLVMYLRKVKSPLLLNLTNTGPLLYFNKILTLHDIAFKTNPEWFSKKFALWYQFIIPKLLSTSKHILTVSEFSRKEISDHYAISKDKITVVHNSSFINFSNETEEEEKVGKKEFFLSVMTASPRKNLDQIIEAFRLIQNETIDLYLVGGEHKSFNNSRENNNLPPNVKKIGYVTDEELIGLYKKARGFIFTPVYEGFGIPPLEAQSCNCPCIVSDIPVFREIYGDSVLYVKLYDEKELADKISLLLSDNDLRNKLIDKGEKNKMNFSWAESGKKVADIVNKYAGKN